MNVVHEADYVIVGAGSAGCILANRLSEAGFRVLLLEAGPGDSHPMIHLPAGMQSLITHPRINWNFYTEPDQGVNDRRLHWPRGKVLGGCSSINGMAYVRGNRTDFDRWAAAGCAGWSYDEILPYFKKSEQYAGGDDAYRGRSGPMRVMDYTPVLPLTHVWVEAATQFGYRRTEDLNGAQHEGVGYSQMSRNGRLRGSTASTFLRQARTRANLRIETDAAATRLHMDGKRCTGVEFMQRGRLQTANAAREVIVSAGAIGSPQLLQVSGIGQAQHLAAIGVPLRHELNGVGQNLRDHYRSSLCFRVKGLKSINELARGWRLAREIARWLLSGTGALTYGITSSSLFCRSSEDVEWPDLQLLFSPSSFDTQRYRLEREPGVTAVICAVRPRSAGSVLAKSPDMAQPPAISPNYLSERSDLDVMLAGYRVARGIFSMPAFEPWLVKETLPGPKIQSAQQLEEFIRATGASLYHPVGTCKMGTDGAAVVDPRLRVRGIDGLRVIDASVMPSLTAGNTAAPVMMIAEKGAAMVLEDTVRSPHAVEAVSA